MTQDTHHRTSETHPLQIAEVRVPNSLGRIGITFCPGKQQLRSMTGSWKRDLCMDLDAVAQWGAALVITLLEPHELQLLQVEHLGAEVRRRHMEWLHLPIRDVSAPGADFRQGWNEVGEQVRARLRDGFAVLVHCKGGLGRAGTIAAQLLIELGVTPTNAIRQVRSARPGAIEVQEQLDCLLDVSPQAEKVPSPALEHQRDRAIGCLLGLAVGDAVGTTLEFTERGTFEPLTNMVGGGPFRLPPGGWTDDTSMALALARSLLANSELDEADLMNRFVAWRRRGEYSWNGRCFDIGMTVSAALQRFESTGNPVAGSIDPLCAGNGSIMRLAPVAIRHRNAADRLLDVARRQSATTHGAQEAVSACELLAEMLVGAINGEPRSRVLRDRSADYAGSVGSIARGGWRGKTRGEIQSTGYVAHTLEAALWCVGRTGSFREAVLLGANLGGDADTTAAVVGQIAGALYGASSIPREWIEQLQWRDEIAALGAELYEHSNR